MAQIAGSFINSVGGVAIFTPFGGAIGAVGNRTAEFGAFSSTNFPPGYGGVSAGNSRALDCADWTLQKHSFLDDVTNTGSYGAQSMDLAAEGWSVNINAIVDQDKPPDMLARYGFEFGRGSPVPATVTGWGFNLGVRLILIQGAGVNYPADLCVDFWWAPSAKIESVSPVIDANSKKMVRMSIVLTGNSRMFKMPAENLIAADYVNNHLANRGQVF